LRSGRGWRRGAVRRILCCRRPSPSDRRGLEVVNVLTYGGVQAAQYPLNIYAGGFESPHVRRATGLRRLLSILAILKRRTRSRADWILPLTPLAGFAFLGLSFLAGVPACALCLDGS